LPELSFESETGVIVLRLKSWRQIDWKNLRKKVQLRLLCLHLNSLAYISDFDAIVIYFASQHQYRFRKMIFHKCKKQPLEKGFDINVSISQ